MLNDADRSEIQNRLRGMKENVTIAYFTQKLAGPCRFCVETEHLLKELTPLSGKLKLEVYNFISDKQAVESFKIDKIPAIALMGEKDQGLRIYGIPSGYEFLTLLEALLNLSAGDSGLSPATREALKALKTPVHIQVFVTPTCPHCPKAAITGLKLAQESGWITCDVVEISEFPHLAQRYGVMGVPKVVINETRGFEGALPESAFVQQVLSASE